MPDDIKESAGAQVTSKHAEMFDSSNTDAYVVDALNEDHAYHTNGLAGLHLNGWSFDAGGAGTSFPIASIANGADAGVDIAVTTTGSHLLAVGDIITQTNLADGAYVGWFAVKAIISATIYEVAAIFTATGTGTMNQGATLRALPGAAGEYSFQWSASAIAETNNDIFDFAIHVGIVHQDSTNQRQKFAIGADSQSMGGISVLEIADNDYISFMIKNTSGAGNITLRDFTLVLVRI